MESILKLLDPSSSDEEKWVGLYLIPKTISPNDLNDIQTIFDHLPWHFLQKLLNRRMRFPTHHVLLEFTSDQQESQEPLYAIGIHIWAAFAQFENLLMSDKMLNLVPLLAGYLSLYIYFAFIRQIGIRRCIGIAPHGHDLSHTTGSRSNGIGKTRHLGENVVSAQEFFLKDSGFIL